MASGELRPLLNKNQDTSVLLLPVMNIATQASGEKWDTDMRVEAELYSYNIIAIFLKYFCNINKN